MKGTAHSKRPDFPAEAAIPDGLRNLTAVVAGVFSADGALYDANRGLLDLLAATGEGREPVDIRGLFVNPRFERIAGQRGARQEGVVFSGNLNLGDAAGEVHALRGDVRRSKGRLVLIAEYDLKALEQANADLLAVNLALASGGRTVPPGRWGTAESTARSLDHHEPQSRTYKPRTRLLQQGDRCAFAFQITEGWVVLYHLLEDGRRQVLDFALPGDFIGLQAWLARPIGYTAECVTSVRALIYEWARIEADIREHGGKCGQLLRCVCLQAARAHHHLIDTARCTARERTVHLLLELFVRARGHPPMADGERIPFPLSQNLLADALGLRGETVSRCLKHLRENGIVQVHGGELIVLDAARFAGSEAGGT